MKSIDTIKAEIAEIDKMIDSNNDNYNNGIITEETLNLVKNRLTSAKNALLWVLKDEAEPTAKTEYGTEYSESGDMTFIMEYKTIDGEPSTLSVVGFYFGEPDAEATKRYVGSLTAHFELD